MQFPGEQADRKKCFISLCVVLLALNIGLAWRCVYWHHRTIQLQQRMTCLKAYTVDSEGDSGTTHLVMQLGAKGGDVLTVTQRQAEKAGLRIVSIQMQDRDYVYGIVLRGSYAELIVFLNDLGQILPPIAVQLESIHQQEEGNLLIHLAVRAAEINKNNK